MSAKTLHCNVPTQARNAVVASVASSIARRTQTIGTWSRPTDRPSSKARQTNGRFGRWRRTAAAAWTSIPSAADANRGPACWSVCRIAAEAIEKDKQITGEGILPENLLHQGVQPIEALPHVGGSGAKEHADVGSQADHPCVSCVARLPQASLHGSRNHFRRRTPRQTHDRAAWQVDPHARRG
jgi:hypothetical protein